MSKKEEAEILKKHDPNFKKFTASEISELVKDKVSTADKKVFMKSTGPMTQMAQEAEEFVQANQTFRAIQMLERALTMSYFGTEYPYGVLGDAYLKKGDREKAYEMYMKSGSYDSLKKAKGLE